MMRAVMYDYSPEYGNSLLSHGRAMRSFDWCKKERADFIGMYRMGGEL